MRKAGVNLFVSLEHILEEIVSYNVWLLSSDHFLNTKFQFDLIKAIKSVSKVLGPSKESGKITVYWDDKGGNTLGTLLVYLLATSEWVSQLESREKILVKRPNEDLPHFIEEAERIFPFYHTELWADSSIKELNVYAANFEKVSKIFAASNLAEIRNGLDHKRNDTTFPTIDAMLACCARLGEAFNLVDIFRFIPKTYWLMQYNKDIYGRIQSEVKDYQKKTLHLFSPSEMSGLPKIRFGNPVIIPSGNLLGLYNSEIILGMKESSSYSIYWEGYPRRRYIPAKEENKVTVME